MHCRHAARHRERKPRAQQGSAAALLLVLQQARCAHYREHSRNPTSGKRVSKLGLDMREVYGVGCRFRAQ